jgi:hypothetical protein
MFGCSGGGSSSGTVTTTFNSVITKSVALSPNDTCANGGIELGIGIDLNGNGILDPTEVKSTQIVCNGADGSSSLVRIFTEPTGANCAVGGTKIETGVDANLDGVLASAEVTDTAYVCTGAAGATGATGAQGPIGLTGATGAAGATGATGANGFSALIKTTPLPAGVQCSAGGTTVQSGMDLNLNNTLDTAEISSTTNLCNAANILIPPTLVLPPHLYLTPGQETSMYFDNILLAANSGDYLWDIANSNTNSGRQYLNRWTFTPSGEITASTLIVSVYDKQSGTLLTQGKVPYSAAPATAGTGKLLKCLFIGDSLTSGDKYTGKLLTLSNNDSMKLNLYGTIGTPPNVNEGRPGWTIKSYTTGYSDSVNGTNPFWIGDVINFPEYLTSNSIPTLDWVFILLGTNDVFSILTDATAISHAKTQFASLDLLINSIKESGPNVKVAIITPPPPTISQDLFSLNYGDGQNQWRFKRNILLWNQELIYKYSGITSSNIYVVPMFQSIDTVNNLANGVHPSAAGYSQIADSIWAFLKENSK